MPFKEAAGASKPRTPKKKPRRAKKKPADGGRRAPKNVNRRAAHDEAKIAHSSPAAQPPASITARCEELERRGYKFVIVEPNPTPEPPWRKDDKYWFSINYGREYRLRPAFAGEAAASGVNPAKVAHPIFDGEAETFCVITRRVERRSFVRRLLWLPDGFLEAIKELENVEPLLQGVLFALDIDRAVTFDEVWGWASWFANNPGREP